MSKILRFLPILRVSLLRNRQRFPIFRTIHSTMSDEHRQTIGLMRCFSTSTIFNARRKKDDVDLNAAEEYDEDEQGGEGKDQEDQETDQTEQDKIRQSLQQYNLPKGYRIIIKHLASLRLDLICSAGTGMGRSAIEDEFYGSKLRVNGEKSSKKAQQVKESDVIDLVVSRIEGAKYVSKRIIVYKVFPDRSMKNKVKVCLISWRQGIEVDGSQWN